MRRLQRETYVGSSSFILILHLFLSICYKYIIINVILIKIIKDLKKNCKYFNYGVFNMWRETILKNLDTRNNTRYQLDCIDPGSCPWRIRLDTKTVFMNFEYIDTYFMFLSNGKLGPNIFIQRTVKFYIFNFKYVSFFTG